MWNKLTQVAGLGTTTTDPTVSASSSVILDDEEQIARQNDEIRKLKDIVRENERLFQERNKELEEANSKLQKFKLQSKAKICLLNNRIKELEKSTKRDDGDMEDASSSDSSDQSKRGKVIVLKKQLEQARQLIEKKEKEMEEMNRNFEAVVKDLHMVSDESKKRNSVEQVDTCQLSLVDEPKDVFQGGANVQEMYAQIVYKDSKIMELNNHILEHERKIIDLQEHIKEKEEVLQSRNRAIQLMTAEMNRKGKSVIDELEEVRGEMRIMQENFAVAEVEWKAEKDSLHLEIKEAKDKFEKEIAERNLKIKNSAESFKKLEVARYDLATKNAELQRKLVIVQENADKRCETLQNLMKEEHQNLIRSTEQEKAHSMELQKALEEVANQSEAKVLKARVKERTKLKALERELTALKKAGDHTTDEVTQLHQHIAELEEEKGTFQLKLIEVEEQIALQGQLKSDNASLHCSVNEINEKYEQIGMVALKLEKENNDLQLQLDEIKLQFKQLLSESAIKMYDQENKDLFKSLTILKDEKVSLEMKVTEVKEQREGDVCDKQDLFYQLSRLRDILNSGKLSIISLEKENDDLKEKVIQFEKLYKTDQQELQNVVHQSNCFQKELNELQNKYSNIVEENEKFKLENELLVSALNDKEEMLREMKISEKSVNINDEKDLEITSLVEKYNSLQVLLNDLFSLCCVSGLNELKEKYLDMMGNVKNLSCSLLDKDAEIDCCKSKHNAVIKEVEKLQLDLESNNNELRDCFEVTESLKMHLSDQEKVYKDEINKLNQSIKDKEKEKLDLISAVSEKEKLLQTTNNNIQEKDELIRNLTENIGQQSDFISQLEKQSIFSSNEIEDLREAKKADAGKMQSKLSSVLEQITDLEAEVSELQAEVSSKQQTCNNLEKRSSHFEILYKDLFEEQRKQNSMCKDHEEMLKNLQQQISSLGNELEKKNQEIETVYRTLKDEYETEKGTILKVNQSTINSLEITLNAFQTEKEELLRVNMLKDSEIKGLQTSLKEHIQKLDSETMKSNDIFHKYEHVNDENISINKQLLNAKSQIQTLETAASEFSVWLSEKDEINKKLLSANLTFEMDLNHLKKENEILFCMSNEVKLENELLTKQNEDISKELEMAKNELSTVRSTLHDEVLKKKSLRQTLAKCESEIKMLNEKPVYLYDENRILSEENCGLTVLTKEQKQRIDEMNEKETLLQHELKNLNENVHELEKQKTDMAEHVMGLERTLQTLKEVQKSSLEESKSQIGALQEKIKCFEKENASIKAEKTALSDFYSSKLNNMTHEIHSYQHELLCAKAENEECRSMLETETKAKVHLLEKMSRYEATKKCLKNALLCAFKNNKQLKTYLLNLKSEAELKLNQYSSDLVHLQNELNVITGSVHQKENELMTLLENSFSEKAVLSKANNDFSERLKNSVLLVQNLTEERDTLQGLTVQLKQQVDDLIGKLLIKEQCQLSLEQKMEEYEKRLASFQKNLEHLTLLKTQYVYIAEKLRNLVNDQIKENVTDEEPDLEFPKDFYVLEDIMKCIENRYIGYKQETSQLHSQMNKLYDEKESLAEFSQIVQDENTSLLERISYLENDKDALTSFLFTFPTEICNITKKNSVTLNAVLDSIDSKNVILGNMESSVAILKKTFSVLKDKVSVLQFENTTMKEKIQCNSEEILYLQNINNNFLKEKNNSKVQYDEQEMQCKKLIKHITLLQVIGNWVSEQAKKNRHLTKHLQLSLRKHGLLPDEICVEKCEPEKQKTHSEVKADEMAFFEVDTLDPENPLLEIIFHQNVQCKEYESSEQQLYLTDSKMKELMSNATREELPEEQNKYADAMSNLISALKDSEISINKLQYQIKKLADKDCSHLKQKCHLELSLQASNSSQTEVEHLHSSLSTVEEQKLVLQQKLQRIMCKSDYEKVDNLGKIDLLQAEVARFTHINRESVEKLDEKNNAPANKHAKYDELECLQIIESEKLHLAEQETNFSKPEFEEIHEDTNIIYNKSKEDEELKQCTENVLKHNYEMKMHLSDLCEMLCEKINNNPNLFHELGYLQGIDGSNMDKDTDKLAAFLKNNINIILMTLNEKQCKIQEALSDLETVKAGKDDVIKTLNDKSHLCEELCAKIEESTKSLLEAQEKLKLGKYSVELKTDAIQVDENFTQLSSAAVEDQCLTEKLQDGSLEKHCCNSEDCRVAIESLYHQLNTQKFKYDKMLTKLRISRNQVKELQDIIKELTYANEKLTTSHDDNLMLKKQQLESHEKLQHDWRTLERENNLEIHRLNGLVSELKERNSLESNMGDKLRTELQQYKDLWEQCNSTFELQKEENEQLRLKLKVSFDELEDVNLKMSELKYKFIASDAEKKQLHHVVEGLKENINMLISDNDTFQELIEKLSQSKAALEKDVAKLKENNPREISELNEKFQSEIIELTARLQVAEEQKTTLSVIEGKYKQLEVRYSLLEQNNKFLENRIQDILNGKKLHENQNKDMYNELCSKVDELHYMRMTCAPDSINVSRPSEELHSEKKSEKNKASQVEGREIFQHGFPLCSIPALQDLNQNVASQHQAESQNFSSMNAPGGKVNLQDLEQQIVVLIQEKQALELHIRYLTEELQSSMIKKEVALEEYLAKEKQWKENQVRNELQLQKQTAYLQTQLLAATSQADLGAEIVPEPVNNEKYHLLETELQQAVHNLHRQGLRCEELSLEVSKLLEERNGLRLKLSHCQQHTHDILPKSGLVFRDGSACVDELSTVKVMMHSEDSSTKAVTSSEYVQPSDFQADITKLLEQLHQSEETCTKLSNENKALDAALISEQEQRKLLEDELRFAKQHLVKSMKSPNDECQVLLGDFDEPEMFVETNFSITRRMQSKAWKFRRWVRGRRNYLCAAVQSKYYCRFLYFVYLFAVHVWVILCTFGHS